MLCILPLIVLVLLILIVHQKENDLRSSILSAAIIWGLLVTAFTEILSALKLLTLPWLAGLYGCSNIILFYAYFRFNKHQKSFGNISRIRSRSVSLILLLCGAAFIIFAVGLTALIYPPNNWDSMTYHMPRVVHWIQNRSVDHYPTHYLPQLYQSPWSEFAIMHLQILSGGDAFANLIQWFSMVGSIIGVSTIAQQLGANCRGQIFSVVISTTIPMGILQGSSTQNDYVVSFWLVCLAYFVILTIKSQLTWFSLLGVSGSLGLAVLTKGTAYIYAFPFMIWFLASVIKSFTWKSWKYILFLFFVFIIINLGHYSRNFELFGKFIATGEHKYTNELVSIASFISNFIRNIGLQIQTPIKFLDKWFEQIIYLIHKLIMIDISDPRTTWTGKQFFLITDSRLFHEDRAASPVHILLILFAILLGAIKRKLIQQKQLIIYCVIVTGCFMLFCLMLKWQPFNTRLHLPILILFSPFVGTIISKFFTRKIVYIISIILLTLSLHWTFHNLSRPLLGKGNIFKLNRIEAYMINRKDLRQPYIKAAEFLGSQDCSQISLSLYPNAYEYPLWILLQSQKFSKKVEIKNINVTNISSKKITLHSYRSFTPCAIISLESPQNYQEEISKKIVINKEQYTNKFSSNQVTVLIKD